MKTTRFSLHLGFTDPSDYTEHVYDGEERMLLANAEHELHEEQAEGEAL